MKITIKICASFFGIDANPVLAGTEVNNNCGIIRSIFIQIIVFYCVMFHLAAPSFITLLSQQKRAGFIFVFKLRIHQFCSLVEAEGIKGKIKSKPLETFTHALP